MTSFLSLSRGRRLLALASVAALTACSGGDDGGTGNGDSGQEDGAAGDSSTQAGGDGAADVGSGDARTGNGGNPDASGEDGGLEDGASVDATEAEAMSDATSADAPGGDAATADATADDDATADATGGDAANADATTEDAALDAADGSNEAGLAIGASCGGAGDCASGNCVDGVCCNVACAGSCYTCVAPSSVGTCIAAVAGTTCLPAACSAGVATAASVCDGAGTCNPGATQSCNPYQCDAAGDACETSCSLDTDCTGGFCSATACIVDPPNLAGNGNLEYGTTAGWTTNGGVTLALSSAAAGGPVHSGLFSIEDSARTANYQGPAYTLPTGAGQYNVTAWAMQSDDTTLSAALQVALTCGGTSTNHYPTIGTYGFALPQGLFTMVSGVVDTSATADCQPTATPTAGVVRSALLYLNQTAAGTSVVNPNLFLDDLVIQVTDGHNLVGNPNFEASTTVTSGWQNNGAGTLGISTTQAHSGANSLSLTGRTSTYNGPLYHLPIGAAKYNVTFYGMHDGTMTHNLSLSATYTCLGGSAAYPTITTATAVPGNQWTQLTGTITLPLANAPAGCQMTTAAVYLQQESGTCGTIECPDLFVDDVSITLAP